MILCYFWATDYCAVCVSPFVVFLANYLLIGIFLWIKTCLFHYFVEQMLRCNYLLYAYNILASILPFNTQFIGQQYWLILKCQNIIFVTGLGASTVYYVHNVLLWFGAKSIAVVMHAFTHWRAWLAEGQSYLQEDRSCASTNSTKVELPKASFSCCSHVSRWSRGRFQSSAGLTLADLDVLIGVSPEDDRKRLLVTSDGRDYNNWRIIWRSEGRTHMLAAPWGAGPAKRSCDELIKNS